MKKIIHWCKWKIIHLLIRLRIFNEHKDYYISKVSRKAPWVYVSYISDVFKHLDNEKYLNSHQNKRETIEIVKTFNKLGYNVYVQDYFSHGKLPNLKNVKIIFGHEPNMVRASLKYPNAKKIYYATGAYGNHQNNQVIKMTDYVNRLYRSNLPYRRLVDSSSSENSIETAYSIADHILLIGSKYTIETFPKEYRNKITTIKQSSQIDSVEINTSVNPENEFFFMGSSGNMLKGLPLIIEYFKTNTKKIIHIVGPIEDDYFKLIRDELTNNIIIHGFMDINSSEFQNIVKRCNFIVYPSGSEGMPGAVINSMKLGLIPIVTPWAAFNEIEEYGYLMKNWNVESLSLGIEWTENLTSAEIDVLKKKCREYILKNYTLKGFALQFETYIKRIEQ